MTDTAHITGDAIVDRLRRATPFGLEDHSLLTDSIAYIARLHLLVIDLLEWADHDPTCLVDEAECVCGYDHLASEWKSIRRG